MPEGVAGADCGGMGGLGVCFENVACVVTSPPDAQEKGAEAEGWDCLVMNSTALSQRGWAGVWVWSRSGRNQDKITSLASSSVVVCDVGSELQHHMLL